MSSFGFQTYPGLSFVSNSTSLSAKKSLGGGSAGSARGCVETSEDCSVEGCRSEGSDEDLVISWVLGFSTVSMLTEKLVSDLVGLSSVVSSFAVWISVELSFEGAEKRIKIINFSWNRILIMGIHWFGTIFC